MTFTGDSANHSPTQRQLPAFYTKDFQHQAVRDLAWCCFSPPLLHNLPESDAQIWTNDDPERDLHWLKQLDQNPAPLVAHLANGKSTRLGIYYENLWHFYWQQNPATQLLAHNLQLNRPENDKNNNKGSTLGAFDFLVQIADQHWHIETAVKFYLGLVTDVQSPSKWQEWIGPNCTDRLDIKLNHLRHHQLPLSQLVEAQPALKTLVGEQKTWRSALCLQGYLFYPAQQFINAPLASHAQHLRGDWWYLRDFLAQEKTGYWLMLQRDRWLSPAQTQDLHEPHSGANLHALLQHWVEEKQRPLLLAAVNKEGNKWRESTRSFIVPDHWPCTA